MTTPSSISPAARNDAGPTVGKGAASGGAGALPAAGVVYYRATARLPLPSPMELHVQHALDVFATELPDLCNRALMQSGVPTAKIVALLRMYAGFLEGMAVPDDKGAQIG